MSSIFNVIDTRVSLLLLFAPKDVIDVTTFSPTADVGAVGLDPHDVLPGGIYVPGLGPVHQIVPLAVNFEGQSVEPVLRDVERVVVVDVLDPEEKTVADAVRAREPSAVALEGHIGDALPPP